jgi:hypothetical protein
VGLDLGGRTDSWRGEKQERDVSELMMGLVIIPDDISRLDRISFNTG